MCSETQAIELFALNFFAKAQEAIILCFMFCLQLHIVKLKLRVLFNVGYKETLISKGYNDRVRSCTFHKIPSLRQIPHLNITKYASV